MKRRYKLTGLGALVLLAHGWVIDGVQTAMLGWGDENAMPQAMQIAFLQTLAPTQDPAVPVRHVAKPRVPRTLDRAPSPSDAASRALVHEPVLEQPPEPPVHPPEVVASSQPVNVTANHAPIAPNQAQELNWPPSTRLNYLLQGNYRGPVEGSAQVKWVRQGSRYQVQMEVIIGPKVLHLMSRRSISEGEITDHGLRPRRYDELTRIALQEPNRLTILMDEQGVTLANGTRQLGWHDVQDSASQFVHLTWLFTTSPQLLREGQLIDFPLALPRYVDRWRYEVKSEETLYTRVGAIKAWHVAPVREARAGEFLAEAWFAPSLQYLPVRLRIQQSEQNYVELTLDEMPMQALESQSAPPSPASAAK